MKKLLWHLGVSTALLVMLGVAYMAWKHFFPVTAGPGWSWSVYLDDVAMVSALEKGAGNDLYITHEQTNKRGSLVRQGADGHLVEIMSGLDKPDGLARLKDGILISQEGGDYPVLWRHEDGRVESLFPGMAIEGVTAAGDKVYAIEDLKQTGRLWQFDSSTGKASILRDQLVEAEGVTVCPDGQLYYTEKKLGWIKRYAPGANPDAVVFSGLNAPGFILCTADGIWISEDATHQARLLLGTPGAEPQAEPKVVLRHMRSVQTVLPLDADHLLVAEQGRHRILQITRDSLSH